MNTTSAFLEQKINITQIPKTQLNALQNGQKLMAQNVPSIPF